MSNRPFGPLTKTCKAVILFSMTNKSSNLLALLTALLIAPVFLSAQQMSGSMANMSGMGNNANPAPSTQKTSAQTTPATLVGESQTDKEINAAVKMLHSVDGRKEVATSIVDMICANNIYFYACAAKDLSDQNDPTEKKREILLKLTRHFIAGLIKGTNPSPPRFTTAQGIPITGDKNPAAKPLPPAVAIAELYVVIKDGKFSSFLEACATSAEDINQHIICPKQHETDHIDAWLYPFFVAAAQAADDVIWGKNAERVKEVKLDSSNNNSSAPISPGTELNHANPSFGFSKSFSWQDLYVNGAVAQRVITDRKAGTGRDISIKIYTTRDPVTHQLSQQIGIFDYSNPGGGGTPSGIYGRRYPTGKNIDQSITLAPDGPAFHLTIKNGSVTFTKEGDKNPQITTTIAALTNLRLSQIQNQGYEEKIGDQTFKVMGQGGANGSLLLFPCDKNGNVTSTIPEAMADVNKLGPDGYVQNLDASPQKTSLGFFPPGIGQDGNPIGKFYYMKAEGQGNDAYFAPVVCDPQKEKEKCDFPPPPQPPTQQASGADQNSPAAPSGAPPANNQSSAGGTACELSAKDFPNPPVWNGWTFFPGENGIAICVGSHQITANGILKNIESKNGQLSLEMAISDADSKVDPKKLYADLNPNWDYEVSCPDNKTVGGEKLPCSASFKGIHFTKDERYFIPMEKIDKLSGNPPISELAAVRLEFNLNIKSGSIDPTEAEISANSQEGAKGAWENFVKTNPAANQYTQQVEGFIDSQEADSSSQEKILIHPFPGEIKNLGQDTPIVTGFNGKTLTVADLLNVKKDGSASQGH